ncbi:MAG TPA: hypothetical protein VF595_00700 [Tepidisphaeraceae bacterium]|jgi:hypothetical protein
MKNYIGIVLPLIIAMAVVVTSTTTVHFLSPASLEIDSNANERIAEIVPASFKTVAKLGDVVITKFKVVNRLDTSLTLLGANSQCYCTVAEGLPVTIGPRQSSEIAVRVEVKDFDPDGRVVQKLRLLTNRKGDTPPLVVELVRNTSPSGDQ